MDNRIANDMISSGMIPSGEKTQADLGRTQYGSAPSPNKLMDAYKSMYDKKEEVINEHHKKDADGNTIPHEGEELNEGKIPAGLQAYLDKKKGKKEDKKEDKKDMKEEVDKFDVVFNHFISEGYSEKEAYAKMANLTEEQLDEFLKALAQAGMRGAQSIGKATRGVSTSLAKQGAMTDPKFKRLGSVQGPAPNTPSQTLTDLRQRRQQQSDNLRSRIDTAASQLKSGSLKFGVQTPISKPKPDPSPEQKELARKKTPITIRKKEVMQDEYQYVNEIAQFIPMLAKGAAVVGKALKPVKKILNNPTVQNIATQTAVGAAMNSGGGQQKQRTGTISASADLFDIVKGQLLDEGLSEEEIRDIMLTLTPDEILNEISVGKMGDYISAASKDVQKTASSLDKDSESGKKITSDDPRIDKMAKRTKSMALAGTKVAKKLTPSPLPPLPKTEEYKGSGTPEQQAAMKAQVEVSKKVNRYGGKTPSGTTAVDAKKGIEDVRKSM